MARKLRVQYEGAIYHVTVRGVERRTIFGDDHERERFMNRLGEAVEEYGVRLYLFCLMGNHAHLLVETPQANLSAFMHKLQTAYTVFYNLRHKRAGHLMQGRFGAEEVQGDEYLLKLSRYIHLNPVFIGDIKKQPLKIRREHLRAYPWSSYRGYAGIVKPYEFVEEAPVLAMLETAAKKRRVAYRRFVEAGIAETDAEFMELLKASPWGIGDSGFQDRIRDLHTAMTGQVRRKEDVSFRRVAPRISAEAVLRVVAKAFEMDAAALRKRQYNCVARSVAALMLGRAVGMNQRDIGSLLCMGTGSAVCRQLQGLRERREQDPDMTRRIDKIVGEIENDKEPTRTQQISIIKG